MRNKVHVACHVPGFDLETQRRKVSDATTELPRHVVETLDLNKDSVWTSLLALCSAMYGLTSQWPLQAKNVDIVGGGGGGTMPIAHSLFKGSLSINVCEALKTFEGL